MSKYLLIESHHQLIVKCFYPWNVWEKCDPAWGDHFISSRYCVSCRFCQNSFCHFYQPACAPEEKVLVDMGEESPGIRVKFWNSLLLEIMAKLMKMWGKGRHRRWGYVVFSAPALAISGFELHGFIFSEIVRRKRLERHTSSEGVIGTSRPLQCEFSNLHTSLAFGLLE